MKKDTNAKELEKKLLKRNSKDIVCKITLFCFYLLLGLTSLDLITAVFMSNLDITMIIGMTTVILLSFLCIRCVIQYRKKNRNEIVKKYIEDNSNTKLR